MNEILKQPSLKKIGSIKRQRVKLSPQNMIKIDYLEPDCPLPVVIPGGDLISAAVYWNVSPD